MHGFMDFNQKAKKKNLGRREPRPHLNGSIEYCYIVNNQFPRLPWFEFLSPNIEMDG